MKAILEAGITWLKNKLYQKTADVLAETVKKSVEESIINKIEPIREKVTTPIDSLSKAHDRITETFKEKQTEAKTLTEKGRWLSEALNKEEEANHSSNQPDFIATEPTKAHFDVKLYDAVEDVEYDKRIVVEHRVEHRHPSVVVILNIEEKARSARNHKPDRNLVDDRSPNLPQAIRTYYELSGIQVKEIYHLHLPGTKVQEV